MGRLDASHQAGGFAPLHDTNRRRPWRDYRSRRIAIARGPFHSRSAILPLCCRSGEADRVACCALLLWEEAEVIAHACGVPDPTGLLPRHVTGIERAVGEFRAAQGGD
jgi:hypothetical protein